MAPRWWGRSCVRPGFCGAYGFKPTWGGINRGGSLDFLSQSCTGTIAASLADVWAMARAISERVGGDPGRPGLAGPLTLPDARAPTRLALLRTAGWLILEQSARGALEAALERLGSQGVEILTAENCVELAEVENATATAREHTLGINAWEWRWPLGSYVARDPTGLSESALERHARAASMTQPEYVELLAHRDSARASLKKLADQCDALISVTAPGAAPVGLSTTGDPIFVVPGSYLGVPGVSLPLLQADGLPLGLQLLGFPDQDSTLFAHAAWVEKALS